jgi:hypothetical protein
VRPDYKKKIQAGTVLLVTAELESVAPRKVWMKASVTDGRKAAFATARALFVAPNLGRQLAGLFKWNGSSSSSSSAGANSSSSGGAKQLQGAGGAVQAPA